MELFPHSEKEVMTMAKRGWKVDVVHESKLDNYLAEGAGRPFSIVLRGPLRAGEIRRFVKFGYKRWARITRKDWPAGGPDPSVLDFVELPAKLGTVLPEEDLYLERVK